MNAKAILSYKVKKVRLKGEGLIIVFELGWRPFLALH